MCPKFEGNCGAYNFFNYCRRIRDRVGRNKIVGIFCMWSSIIFSYPQDSIDKKFYRATSRLISTYVNDLFQRVRLFELLDGKFVIKAREKSKKQKTKSTVNAMFVQIHEFYYSVIIVRTLVRIMGTNMTSGCGKFISFC